MSGSFEDSAQTLPKAVPFKKQEKNKVHKLNAKTDLFLLPMGHHHMTVLGVDTIFFGQTT